MFFKKSQNNTQHADTACWFTFIFWGIILLVNSIFETLYRKPLISSSLIILISGLLLFFLVDQIFSAIKKRKI